MIPKFQKYGVAWNEGTDPIGIELGMYSREDWREMAGGKCLSRWEHMRNAIRLLCPEHIFVWHRWVDTVGEEWCENTALSLWGAGGTTKSGVMGMLAYVDLLCAPKDTLTVMLTCPLEKHWDRCFSKALMWRRAMPTRFQIGRLVKSPKPVLLTVEGDEGSRRGIVCISADPGESGSDMAKKVGAHAPRTRLIVDEGQGAGGAVLDIGVNLFIGSTEQKEVFLGNPTSWSNSLGMISKPLDGDTRRIATEEPDRWEIGRSWGEKPGVCVVLDGRRAPTWDNAETARKLRGIMIQPEDVKTRAKLPGFVNSLQWYSQVCGRIPPAGAILTVISDLDLQTSGCQKAITNWTGPVTEYVGGDLSLGGDKVPMYRVKVGQAGSLGLVASIAGREYLTCDRTKADRTGQMSQQFVELMRRWGVRDLARVALDASGQQGAIVDTFERDFNATNDTTGRIYRVKSEEKVTERRLSYGKKDGQGKRERACDRYKHRNTELVMNLVECVWQQCLFGIDDEISFQLSTRGVDEKAQDGGLMEVQAKKDWREENGDQSPDEMDAVAVVVALLLEKGILKPGRQTVETREPQLEPFMMKGAQLRGPMGGHRRKAALARRW